MEIKVIVFFILVFLVCCLFFYGYVKNLADNISKEKEEAIPNTPPLELGLYIFPDLDNEVGCVSLTPDLELITKTVNESDWNYISFVMLVKGVNHSVEVSGSLHDGFAALYENKGIRQILEKPPEDISAMVKILCEFHKDESQALKKYKFT